MKHRLNLDTLTVQSFSTQPLADDEAYLGVESKTQCISEVSACGICPTDTYA